MDIRGASGEGRLLGAEGPASRLEDERQEPRGERRRGRGRGFGDDSDSLAFLSLFLFLGPFFLSLRPFFLFLRLALQILFSFLLRHFILLV